MKQKGQTKEITENSKVGTLNISNLNTMTIKELKAKLDELKLEYSKSEKKAYYVEMLSSVVIPEEKPGEKIAKKPAKNAETKTTMKKKVAKTAKNSSIKSKSSVAIDDKPSFIRSNKLSSIDSFFSSASIDRSKITIIMRDAKWLFAYWELGGSLYERCKSEIEGNDGNIEYVTLRIINEHGHFYDIDIKYGASSFYFEPTLEGSVKVELGLKSRGGRFYSVAISNTLKVSEIKDITMDTPDNFIWMDGNNNIIKAHEGLNTEVIIESLGGVKYIKKIIGSEEFLNVLKENISSTVSSKLISTIVSSFVSSISSSSSYHSSDVTPVSPMANVVTTSEDENDAFWLIADTELILYGATEPDAKLTVAGKNISLNPDGTFFLRMPLPDGDVSLPVEAYSSNGKHYRKIHPQVKKWTD